MLAFGLLALREYDQTWHLIKYSVALAILSFTIAAAAMAMRVMAIKNIETLGGQEMFEGRAPDPESAAYQRKVADYMRLYRAAGKVGLPSFTLGVASLTVGIVSIVLFHLTTP